MSCGSRGAIPAVEARVEELDLEKALAGGLAAEATVERLTISCASCGAQSTLAAGVSADHCPFCGTAFVATASSTRSLQPHWLLPFRIAIEEARARFRAWVHSLWFAPSRLAREASAGRIDGMYVPYWTFDAATTSRYTGERGEDYTVSESYTDGSGRNTRDGRYRSGSCGRLAAAHAWAGSDGREHCTHLGRLGDSQRSNERNQAEREQHGAHAEHVPNGGSLIVIAGL